MLEEESKAQLRQASPAVREWDQEQMLGILTRNRGGLIRDREPAVTLSGWTYSATSSVSLVERQQVLLQSLGLGVTGTHLPTMGVEQQPKAV